MEHFALKRLTRAIQNWEFTSVHDVNVNILHDEELELNLEIYEEDFMK